jgi:hypothetical protein
MSHLSKASPRIDWTVLLQGHISHAVLLLVILTFLNLSFVAFYKRVFSQNHFRQFYKLLHLQHCLEGTSYKDEVSRIKLRSRPTDEMLPSE